MKPVLEQRLGRWHSKLEDRADYSLDNALRRIVDLTNGQRAFHLNLAENQFIAGGKVYLVEPGDPQHELMQPIDRKN